MSSPKTNKMKQTTLYFSTILLLSLCIGSKTFAQNTMLKNYNFSDEKIEIPEKYKNENEVILQKDVKIDLVTTENSALQYFLIHEKKWINSDDAVQRNNKIYIPFRSDENLITNKVRVITENGKIIELNPKDIKEETDEEQGIKYNYYAVNGLSKGSIIEKIFLIEEAPDLEGKSINLQDELATIKTSFELIYPKHLIFKYKSYNGLAEAQSQNNTIDTTKYSLLIAQDNIDGLSDNERYSNWEKYVKRFKYKLDENTATGSKKLHNYVDFSKNVYDNIYLTLDKKEQKAIENFIKQIPTSSDATTQLKNIENKIKNSITYNKYFDKNKNLADVLTSKQANSLFLIRLYTAVLNEFKIENQLVFTSKRFVQYFDKDFETQDQLNDVLIYFPKTNQYLDFTSFEYRLPLVNFNYGDNYGLFVKEKEFGGAKMGMGEIKKIKIPGTELTHDTQDITIDFTQDIENPTISANYKFNGYSAMNMQPVKDFVDKNQYNSILNDFAKNYTVETNFISLKTENDGLEFVGSKPYVLDVSFLGKTQKAGNNILFKAGETIGKQMELYQEDKRVLPIELYYPHAYTRTLKFLLPQGYKIKNLDAFNFDKTVVIEGKKEAEFKSSYVVNGNEVLVTNSEYYNVIDFPLEVFEAYRETINAAADFNKITIILTKE